MMITTRKPHTMKKNEYYRNEIENATEIHTFATRYLLTGCDKLR